MKYGDGLVTTETGRSVGLTKKQVNVRVRIKGILTLLRNVAPNPETLGFNMI